MIQRAQNKLLKKPSLLAKSPLIFYFPCGPRSCSHGSSRRKATPAAREYQQAAGVATDQQGNQLPIAATALVGHSKILREWNDLGNAHRHLQQAIELGRSGGLDIPLVDAYITLALTLRGQQELDEAHLALDRAEAIVQAWPSARLRQRVGAFRARLWLAQGNYPAAARWAADSPVSADDEPTTAYEIEHTTLARILIANRQSREATNLLERLYQVALERGLTGRSIELLILMALALQADDDIEGALRALQEALTLAEPEGYVRIFVDEGEPMVTLLRRAATAGIAPRYAASLLAAFPRASIPAQPLIDPLTARELEVLQLLATGFSNREVASELVIAPSTAKRHIANIYGKLGVSSRTQAAARARELNLLD